MENSTSQSLTDLSIQSGNAIEILKKVTESFSSNETTVSATLTDSNGNAYTINIPSLYKLDSDIKRLETNLNELSGLNSTAYIKQADGSTKRIIVSSTSKTPAPIETLSVPTTFDRKNNWFFENFLSPLLFITFDLTNLIDDKTKKIAVKRVILSLTNPTKRQIFETNLLNRNDLNYESTLMYLNSNEISYFIDDDIYEIPPSILRYEGSFGVVSYFDSTDENGSTTRYYRLTNVDYSDNLESTKNTINLKSGDTLALNDSTKFSVEYIDVASREVTLKRISGNSSVPIGDNVLSYVSTVYSPKEINVNIGYDEKQIIFISPINTDDNIASMVYSNGVCFNSSSLVITDGSGNQMNLEQYYQQEVTDFGMLLLSLSKDRQIPSLYGLIPNKPVLEQTSFKVEQINDHLTQTTSIEQIKKDIATKTQIKEQIKNLDTEIITSVEAQKGINDKNSTAYTTLSKKIDDAVKKKNGLIGQYVAIVNTLSQIFKTNSKDKLTPKYRIRGLWKYPESKYSQRTGNQEVVQFLVSYRYLNKETKSEASATKLTYTGADGKQYEGYFSNWIELKTKVRPKSYDVADKKFIWVTEDEKDPTVITSNQVEIPISVAESVEIKIKSISEAGFPTNPMMSDFSDSIIVDYPDNLEDNLDLYTILEDIAREEERGIILNTLSSYELEKHTRDSKTVNNRYFAHSAYDLDSGYKNSDGSIISVYDYITSLKNEIGVLRGLIDSLPKNNGGGSVSGGGTGGPILTGGLRGSLNVYVNVTDSDGKVTKYDVTSSNIDVVLKSYYDELLRLDVTNRRGAIIKKKMELVIENNGNNVLYLRTPYSGGEAELLPNQSISGTTITTGTYYWKNSAFTGDLDYITKKKYNKVPLRYSDFLTRTITTPNKNLFGFGNQQSSQVCGQFVYLRYSSINGDRVLYQNSSTPILKPQITALPSINKNRSFVWSGSYDQTTPRGNGNPNEFAVHVNHPELKTGSKHPNEINNSSQYREYLMAHSDYFQYDSSTTNGNYQLELNSTDKFAVLGFKDSDRYLIGSNTCGAYLYMMPPNPNYIRVGNNSTDYKTLAPNQTIKIPIVFEYRLADYFDDGDSLTNKNASNSLLSSINKNQVIGIVGGYNQTNYNSSPSSTKGYKKTLGIDIYYSQFQDEQPRQFSFDLTVGVQYGNTKNTIALNASNYNLTDTNSTGLGYTQEGTLTFTPKSELS